MWTDDPIADAERYIAKQEEELERLPKRGCCNNPIQDDYCYEINDELICQECLDLFHRKPVEDYVG